MSKGSMKDFIKHAEIWTTKHSPEILMVAGIAGTIVGTVLACKATTKVSEIIEEKNKNIEDVHTCLEDNTKEYTEEDSQSFFDSVGDFIDGIFNSNEIVENAEFPVVGKSFKDITSGYGKRTAPTSGASTFHSGIDIGAFMNNYIIDDNVIEKTKTYS